ncbi:MAG: hypothetical protein H6Q91_1674 [Deltaproteobacteria bacterium]|nr:hypothetical protein [Deltaproteobacteria bacterium]
MIPDEQQRWVAQRSAEDLLWEILLKSGFPLTTPVETLTLGAIRAIAERKSLRVVLLDEGFAKNDQLEVNAVQRFRTKGVASFYGIVIRMFFRDHAPSHFHVEYSGHKAEILIETLEVVAGSLPRRTLGLAMEWAALHRDELRAGWSRCQRHERPIPIEPLE